MTDRLRIVPMGEWIAYHSGIGSNSACAIANSEGEVVSIAVTRGSGFHPPEATPIAQRIVACCNACTGIPTEQLESDFAQGYEPWGHVQHLRAQRDELLEALILLVRTHEEPAETALEEARELQWLEQAQAAIAKALGPT